MATVYAFVSHKDGVLDDSAAELAAAAKKFTSAPVTAIVTGSGVDAAAAKAAELFPAVWKIDAAELAYPNAEVVRKALLNNLAAGAVVLMANNTFGMDLGPGLAVKLGGAYVSDVVAIEGADGDTLKVVRQEYGGVVSTHVTVDMSAGAVITVRPGAIAAEEGAAVGGAVEAKAAGDLAAKRKFIEVREPEAGDVDITKAEVLVSVGRGIEDQENIEIAHELAKAIGSHAEVSCSRPIVDAKWMDASRQVGTSGKSVKPKVYLAMGISGSFQHMGGIKGGLVVAVNKNPNAPIFQVANVGIEADILEFIPALTEALEEL
ncbi:electron transfer flavoprotein subunit alpha/FixB family protein [Desulfobotulus sp.]|jgi:electron transfer flavoprotein alpha subunit|uniref:electron transfer flavoprotein subunit alpha/FixB family protein n=1 Tax=Desulfobotulus sp. TaxID=1940337 RepID=UPI002A36B518|nr:electron transfer flavoprotein subunit alpha/FixB family protein [Desulfobotulus sp.]MDY0163183.1 electron transfer flavoprotein subunit alpha/FixB family protein [Desulfobotulus sp.]